MSDIVNDLKHLDPKKQRIIWLLGFIASVFGYVAALPDWSDSLRPGFIGATVGALLKDVVNYLLGRGPSVAPDNDNME